MIKFVKKLLGIKSPSRSSLEGIDSRLALNGLCNSLSKASIANDKQKVAESMAKMHLGMTEFMESDYISYESVTSELMKLEVK